MRQIGVNWFYKHIDTSMKIEKSKGVFDLPYALDAKMIFKANKADNAKYNSLVSVDTVNRHAALHPAFQQPGSVHLLQSEL